MKKIKELCKELRVTIQNIVKIRNKIVYKINKKICDLLYRRVTYIPEKGIWVSTVVFPKNIVFSDGEDSATICGVTDVFKGNRDRVKDWIPIHSEYINRITDAKTIHRSVVEDMKTGYIAILG